jgi:hypothetical protein
MLIQVQLSLLVRIILNQIAVPMGRNDIAENGVTCGFGRFGQSTGHLVNATLIKCVTPNIKDDPEDIYRESVTLTVGLNGQDFNDAQSTLEYTFIGTGSNLAFWPWLVGTILIGLLIIALVVCCSSLWHRISVDKSGFAGEERVPHVKDRLPRHVPQGIFGMSPDGRQNQ